MSSLPEIERRRDEREYNDLKKQVGPDRASELLRLERQAERERARMARENKVISPSAPRLDQAKPNNGNLDVDQ